MIKLNLTLRDSQNLLSSPLTLHHAHNANKHAHTQRERAVSATSANEQRLLIEGGREGARRPSKSSSWTQSERASERRRSIGKLAWRERRRAGAQTKDRKLNPKLARTHIQINGTIERVVLCICARGECSRAEKWYCAPRAQNAIWYSFPFLYMH